MRRVIAIVLTGIMTIGMMCVGTQKETKVEGKPLPIIDTITYPTAIDYSKLYSLKKEHRKKEVVDLTQDEAMLLMRISVAEAGNNDAIGQSYIMQVVINRIASEDFPDTVGEVVYQSKQFSSVTDGRLDRTEPDLASHYALYLLESQQVKCDALFFEATWVKDSWQSKNKKKLFEYGGHVFYR